MNKTAMQELIEFAESQVNIPWIVRNKFQYYLEKEKEDKETFAHNKHFAFKKWVDNIVTKGIPDDYKGFNDEQLWTIFTQTFNQ